MGNLHEDLKEIDCNIIAKTVADLALPRMHHEEACHIIFQVGLLEHFRGCFLIAVFVI